MLELPHRHSLKRLIHLKNLNLRNIPLPTPFLHNNVDVSDHDISPAAAFSARIRPLRPLRIANSAGKSVGPACHVRQTMVSPRIPRSDRRRSRRIPRYHPGRVKDTKASEAALLFFRRRPTGLANAFSAHVRGAAAPTTPRYN